MNFDRKNGEKVQIDVLGFGDEQDIVLEQLTAEEMGLTDMSEAVEMSFCERLNNFMLACAD